MLFIILAETILKFSVSCLCHLFAHECELFLRAYVWDGDKGY